MDDPQAAVRAADALVERLVQAVTSRVAEQRRELDAAVQAEGQEQGGERTERLRLALQRYRSIFRQLTSSGS